VTVHLQESNQNMHMKGKEENEEREGDATDEIVIDTEISYKGNAANAAELEPGTGAVSFTAAAGVAQQINF
jgi:hypothetical protein